MLSLAAYAVCRVNEVIRVQYRHTAGNWVLVTWKVTLARPLNVLGSVALTSGRYTAA